MQSKFIRLILFSLALFLVGEKNWIFISCALTLFTFFAKYRWQWLFLFTCAGWIYLTNHGWHLLYPLFKQWQINFSTSEFLIFRLLVVTVVVVFCSLCILLPRKFPQLKQTPLVFCTAIFLFAFVILAFLDPTLNLKPYYWGVLIIFAQFFWFLAYNIYDQELIKDPRLWKQICTLQPFWGTGTLLPVPGGLRQLEDAEAKNPQDFQTTQQRGLRLIYWILFIQIFVSLFEFFTLGVRAGPARFIPMDAMKIQPFADFTLNTLSGWDFPQSLDATSRIWLWLSAYYKIFQILFYFFSVYGTSIAIMRMAGFFVFRHVYRPLEAKSFAEFLARWLYFYSELIKKFGIYPLFFRLRFLQSSFTRIFLSFFLGIVVVGFSYHWLWYLPDIAKKGFSVAAQTYMNSIPYFIVISLIATVSVMLSSKYRRPFFRNPLPRIILYFIIYGLILSLDRLLYFRGDLDNYLQFIDSFLRFQDWF